MLNGAERLLSDVALIRGGYPFRTAIRDLPDGSVLAVQMKDVDSEAGVDWSSVARTKLPGRIEANVEANLKPGDILYTSRGSRFYAVDLDEVPGHAVAAPHFFHLSVRPGAGVLPKFLTWQMNQPLLARYVDQSAEGTLHRSIRRAVLENMPISIPPLNEQHAIVALAQAVYRERRLLEQLIANRRRQLAGVAELLHARSTGKAQ